ncbi:MAG: HAMP domain-containing histidine kinase [Pirellulaceae bacterium]|jgi:signal transduction histidine kinase|nr:HAMP domain-containing histidine kinase [Pirellulaceae bacterium]
MFERRSLKLPITLGVLMIVSVVALTVGWVLLSTFGAVGNSRWAALYWTLLTVGSAFLVFVLVGVVLYLRLSVETINLNRRQSNFLDSVTHELKSPLASLKLYLQTLERCRVRPEEQASFVRFMLDDVERLDSLINHLLDVARMEHREARAFQGHSDLAEVLEWTVEAVCLRHHVAREIVRLDVEPLAVPARRVDLELVFRNLIDNALKYAADQPQVEVVARRRDGDRAVVRISDNGKGIPSPLRRKIFGRFFRVGEELERETPGLGLGLYIARTMVRRLGGSIRVCDREAGPGTTFEVLLPVLPGEPPRGTVSATPPTTQELDVA